MLYLVSLYYRNNVHSGANKRFYELGRELSQLLDRAVKVVVTDGHAPDWATADQVISIRPYANRFQRVLASRELAQALDEGQPGTVISDFMPIPFASLKKHRHCQQIYDLRNFTAFERGGLSFLTAWFQRRQLQRSPEIVTISRFSKNDIVHRCGIDPDRITVSYCGIHRDYLQTGESGERDIDVLYIATFEPRKNHLGLIEALRLLNRPARALLIGRDLGTLADCRAAAAKASAAGHVEIEFRESVSEASLVDLYSRSRMFVFPSFLEGFGMPLIEAMARNCRVICSDIPVFREICGESARYFDPEHPESIANMINAELNSRESAGRALPLQRFLWDEIAGQLVKDLRLA